MRNKFLSLGLMVLSMSSAAVFAEEISKSAIPAPVLDTFYKKHPNALDMMAEKKTHFKQGLIQISYKEEKDKEINKLFTKKDLKEFKEKLHNLTKLEKGENR